jgi:hypothetical protein
MTKNIDSIKIITRINKVFVSRYKNLLMNLFFLQGCCSLTPNSGYKTVFQYDDVMKLDFGTHVDGNTQGCFSGHVFLG